VADRGARPWLGPTSTLPSAWPPCWGASWWRPSPTEGRPQHLRPDKGYDHPTGHDTVAAFQDVSHLRRFGEAKLDAHGQKTYPAHRWVVERTRAWWSKCRGLLVRDEKNAGNFFGLLQLAWALMWMRLRGRLIGD
jgi:transposase